METRAIARDGGHNTGIPLKPRIGLVTALLSGLLLLAPIAATAFEVSFTRVKPGVSFRVNVTGADAPRIASSRGKVGPVVRTTDGGHQALVTPDDRGTGEYRVTVSARDRSVTRTALVLKSVGDRWGQPVGCDRAERRILQRR